MQAKKMASGRGNVYFVKIGEKPVGDGSQDICKDKAEIIQSKLCFRFAYVLPEVTIIYNLALNNLSA